MTVEYLIMAVMVGFIFGFLAAATIAWLREE